jgi:hypothetical protein
VSLSITAAQPAHWGATPSSSLSSALSPAQRLPFPRRPLVSDAPCRQRAMAMRYGPTCAEPATFAAKPAHNLAGRHTLATPTLYSQSPDPSSRRPCTKAVHPIRITRAHVSLRHASACLSAACRSASQPVQCHPRQAQPHRPGKHLGSVPSRAEPPLSSKLGCPTASAPAGHPRQPPKGMHASAQRALTHGASPAQLAMSHVLIDEPSGRVTTCAKVSRLYAKHG